MSKNERAAPAHTSVGPASDGFQRLLVAIDLTAVSDRVLGRVARLPLGQGAKITLLHVVPKGLPVAVRRKAKQDSSQALLAEVQHLAESLPRHVRVAPLVKVGAAADEIAACARSLKAELIVLGRGGRRALRDVLVGSTAERVIRRARQPVLAVRAAPRASYRRPAVALTLDRAAAGALSMVVRATRPQRSPISVVHAVDVGLQQRIYPSLSREEAAAWRSQVERRAARELDQLLVGTATKPAPGGGAAPYWKVHLRSGSPRLVVEAAVMKLGTDLLVLGTQGHSGAAHVLLGTVAGDVLREVSCDVLLVPAPGGSSPE